ncbi:hypothetical protein [Carboxylicivirga sp. N1Y90]|uniref:hypothetical protein n=1 Tax=Carboxylicivirga fragile TaxID=3417571 RepID=UPI003D34AD92|nr:STAS/SEC14 domain-containing protein [Marinilabiliaceae bacterium N1Y90]
MISYAIIDNIFHVSLSGTIELKDLLTFLKDFSEIENRPEDLKIFYDLTQANVDLHLDDINKLSAIAEKSTLDLSSVKTAFLVEDPKVTAYAMLFSWLPTNERINRKQFSTKDAAIEWLNSNED